MLNQFIPRLSWVFAFLMLSGCATHGDKMQAAKDLIKYEEYAAAEVEINKQLDAQRNRLLRLQELGVLSQLQGDYHRSLELLNQADNLADDLYTRSFADLAMRATTNATFTVYRGNLVERVYINYFKMLNYAYLAQEAESRSDKLNYLDAARVEARRALILLNENVHKTGDYSDAEEQKDSVIYKLQRIFALLNGDVINPKELIFRDDAFSHYLIGAIFEALGELDDARISYERSARLYEQGYAKQYHLAPSITSQAWLETSRMLKARQDNRWKSLAQQKLNKQQIQQLNKSDKQQGHLILIQEIDTVAPRGELNLWVILEGNRIAIRPILTGTPKQKAYQLAWFYYLYADKGLIGVVERIAAEDYLEMLVNVPTKKFPVPAPMRPLLDSLGLTEAMSTTGIRLSVPLLYYEEQPLQASHLEINGKNLGQLNLAENISGLVMAQHLVDAREELTNAMAIETLRLATCMQTGLPPALCTLAAAATTSADTRSWLSLPYEVRVLSLNLPAGQQELNLITSYQGQPQQQTQTITIQPGKMNLVRMRTFAVDPNQPLPEAVVKARAQQTTALKE